MQISKQRLLHEVSEKLRARELFHAVILEGDDAEETAIEIAAACVCTMENKPCGVCAACKKAFARAHADIHISKGTGAAGSFHVAEIRYIRADAYVKPNEAERKVYILLHAEDMNESAQNALLKVLEEPPQDILFILVCENSKLLLPTILSRAVFYDLGTRQKSETTEESQNLCEEIIEALVSKSEMQLLALSAQVISQRDLFAQLLKDLAYIFYRACVAIVCEKELQGAGGKLSNVLTFDRANKLYNLTAQTSEKIEKNANHALLVTAYFSAVYAARYGI